MACRTVAFRCDASVAIGAGHLARCGALAEAMSARGAAAHFLCNAEAGQFLFNVRDYPIEFFFSDDEEALASHVEAISADMIVFDHYDIGPEKERRYRPLAGVLAAIDDLGRRHDVDALVNPMPGARIAEAKATAPAGCEVRCGADWLLLRSEIARLRPRSLARRAAAREARRVFVSLGGADPLGHVVVALEAVERSGIDAQVDLAIGRHAPAIEAVRGIARRSRLDIRLHVDTRRTAELMAEADLAVGAGGVMAWERCALGLPSATLIIADNQEAALPFLVETGAGLAFDARGRLDPAELAEAIGRLAGDRSAREEMSRRAAAVCDARGADRTADLLTALPARPSATASPGSS
jgi:UDP-2,4-diacetamido-2,4,6-trideoxy-beta-L-altropyranose hydrolase